MPEQYYKEAVKLGQKEYRSCVIRGQYPYLPVLDEIIPASLAARGGVDLGVVSVPAEYIVGTKTAGRTTAFARNFMPLMEDKTEFSIKWKSLCKAHLNEGIRDPLKVYEYMNRYYVQEGNKRASVLKFFGAVSIPAQVMRIMPPRTGDKEVEIYYEFVRFYRCSRVNLIEFTKLGSYARLQQAMGKAPEELWTDEERAAFNSTYHYFRQAYLANGGGRLRSTVGDAMLTYIEIYGYQALRNMSAAEMKKSVARVWEEITLQQEEQPIDLKLDPEAEKKRILPMVRASKERKVAFIYDKTPRNSGWTYGHELGRQHVKKVFRGKLVTSAYENAMEMGADQTIEQAIADGNTVIFTASPKLMPASLRVAVEHPEVTILNCSLNQSHRYVRTYYARMYEAKFIIGAIAGALAETDRVGYICDYPIYGMVAGINAFACGVQLVNPRGKVYLEWSSINGLEAATSRLTDRGIDIISSVDMIRPDSGLRKNFGLARVSSDGQAVLAMPVWHWGVYYENLLRRILDRSFQEEEEATGKALNYYWGLSAGVIDLICSERLPAGTRKLAETLRGAVQSGSCHPFSGEIRAQDGTVYGRRDGALSVEQIINMDWLAENVIGSIPSYHELGIDGQTTVDQSGVTPSRKEPGL